jgi:hypothetical protein
MHFAVAGRGPGIQGKSEFGTRFCFGAQGYDCGWFDMIIREMKRAWRSNGRQILKNDGPITKCSFHFHQNGGFLGRAEYLGCPLECGLGRLVYRGRPIERPLVR